MGTRTHARTHTHNGGNSHTRARGGSLRYVKAYTTAQNVNFRILEAGAIFSR